MSSTESFTHRRDSKRRLIQISRRVLYWVLPPLVLYLIFRQVDLKHLEKVVFKADLGLILLGTSLIVFAVVAGALRWRFLSRWQDFTLSVSTSIREYWKGMAVGVLIPGSLGSDAYRVMVMARPTGRYLRGAVVIGAEKLSALFSCVLLVSILYPLLSPDNVPAFVRETATAFYAFFALGIALTVAVILTQQHTWIRRLALSFDAKLEALARRVGCPYPSPENRENKTLQSGGLALILSARSPSLVLPTTGLSLAILFISAAQSQLFFRALGFDLPFSVNLFVTPLLVLLLTLPISFGGIGIREGAYVVLYGAFGVPVETALVVSFCSLASMLLSYAVGTSLFLLGRRREGVALADGEPATQGHQELPIRRKS